MDGPERCTCGYAGQADPATGGACPRCGRALPDLETTHLVLASDPPGPGGPPPWFDAPTINYAAARYTPPTGHTVPTVPGYVILGELGRGGMGVVYKARQVALNRVVALKMILGGGHAGPKARDRFRREAEAVAALQHPHIVQIFEIGEHNGQPYLALELVDGGTLGDQLTGNPWPPRDAAALVARLARTVQYAHEKGIVHRDLKPGNVLIAECGMRNAECNPDPHSAFRIPHSAFVKITDFGLAKRLDDGPGSAPGTGTGAVVGTPSYIAPEQAAGRGRAVGPAADIYSLGAILYELLTGRPPFHGDSPLETVLQVIRDEPVPPARLRPSIPKDLETICLTCLEKTPGRRYPSAAALADDLDRFLDGRPVYARPVSAVVRAAKWAARHPALTALGGTTVAAMAALIAVLMTAYAQVRTAVREKEQEAAWAVFREQEAELLRGRAEAETRRADELRRQFEDLARERGTQLVDVEGERRVLAEENDKAQRSVYALQLSQVAALWAERDPARARDLLADPDRCPERLRELTWHYLRRQCDREELVYDRHADALAGVAAAPDLPLVATAGRGADPAVRVWDPRTGETWAVLDGHAAAVTGVAFGPDGAVAATAEDGAVRVWHLPPALAAAARDGATAVVPPGPPGSEPARVSPAAVIDAHPGPALCVAFGPDGRAVATGGADGTVRLFDLTVCLPAAAGGACAKPRDGRTLTRHAKPVRAVAFRPDGSAVAGGSADGTVRVCPTDGSPPRTLAHAGVVRAVAYSPDGKILATADTGAWSAGRPWDARPAVALWDAATLAPRGRLTGLSSPVVAVAFGPDGQLLAGASDKAVRLWSADDGKDRGVLTGHARAVTGVAFAADRRTLVSAGEDRTARVWLARPAGPDVGAVAADVPVTAAALSPDGKVLVVGLANGATRVYRVDALSATRPVPEGAPTPGRLPLALYCENTLVTGPVNAVAVSPDGRYVAAAGDRGLGVIDLEAMTKTARGAGVQGLLARAFGGGRSVRAAAFSPDGRWLVTAEDYVRVWEVATGKMVRNTLSYLQVPHFAVFNPPGGGRGVTGPLVALPAGPGPGVVDWLGRVAATPPADGLAGVTALAASPDGRLLAAGDATGRVRVWEVAADGELRLTPRADGRHAEWVTALAFTRDGRTLVSASRDRSVVLWDPTTGQERATLTGHADQLVGLGVLPGDAGLVTVGRDGAVRRWRADPKKPDRTPPVLQLSGTGPATGGS